MRPCTEAVILKSQNNMIRLFDLPWIDFVKQVGSTEKILIRKRLLFEQQGRCNRCLNYEWLDHPINLELEHKNGNHHDDSPDNLELLCPNCHSLTPTWRGRNKNKGNRTPISPEKMIEAFTECGNIRQALIKLGLAAKGNNYARMKKVLYEAGLKH